MEILNDKLQHVNDNLIYFIQTALFENDNKFFDAITLREHLKTSEFSLRVRAFVKEKVDDTGFFDEEQWTVKVIELNSDEVEDLAHHQHLCEMF